MEQHHYNTYSSTTHSNARRTLYLALNRHGIPRKVQIPSTRPLGKLATYTKSLTQTVPHDRVEKIITEIFGPTFIRHGLKQLCETGKSLADSQTKLKPKCNPGGGGNGGKKQNSPISNKKKNKNKRKCRNDEIESDNCIKQTNPLNPLTPDQRMQQQLMRRNKNNTGGNPSRLNQNSKCTDDDCINLKKQRQNHKKNQTRIQQTSTNPLVTDQPSNPPNNNNKKNKLNKNPNRNKNRTSQITTSIPQTSGASRLNTRQRKLLPTTTSERPVKTIPTTQTTTQLPPTIVTSILPPYDEDVYSDDPLVVTSSSSTEFHDDDDLDDSSLAPPIGNLAVSQFVDYNFDDDEFDARK